MMKRDIHELFALAKSKQPVELSFEEYALLCREITGSNYFRGGLTILLKPQPDKESK